MKNASKDKAARLQTHSFEKDLADSPRRLPPDNKALSVIIMMMSLRVSPSEASQPMGGGGRKRPKICTVFSKTLQSLISQ